MNTHKKYYLKERGGTVICYINKSYKESADEAESNFHYAKVVALADLVIDSKGHITKNSGRFNLEEILDEKLL